MRTKIFFLTVAVFTIISCGGPKVIVNYRSNAEQAELTGDYEKAVTAWQSYFQKQLEEDANIVGAEYARAAKVAYQAEMKQQAVDWFEQARYKDYADEDMYIILADIFESRDNVSKELEALEYYVNNFESEDMEVNKRLFEIYYTIDMNEKALAVLERIPNDSITSEGMIEKYFLINKEAENDEVTDSVSLVLLEKNPKHVQALEWNATKYYWKAENRYRREMKKYEQNKTGLQYVFLKKELKQVTADFKKALSYFEKLWEINPGKKYAPYMANIHTRFNEDDKAESYKKYLD